MIDHLTLDRLIKLENEFKELDQYTKEQHEQMKLFMRETLSVLKVHQAALKFLGGIDN